MSDSIFLVREGDELVEMSAQPYDRETGLQTLLARYPDLLGGGQLNPGEPRRWLLVRQEMPVPGEEDGARRWSLDHLFLDQDGIPTLVEVKRAKDTRSRREVVAQMLDYAANAQVYWSLETIRGRLAERAATEGNDPDDIVAELIGEDREVDEFWEEVAQNLRTGRLRLLFVADQIPVELRRIVEFLNEQTVLTEVLAVEIGQYVGEGLQTLVPKVYGQTERAQSTKTTTQRQTRQWNRESLLDEIDRRHGASLREVAQAIIEWADKCMSPTYGKGAVSGSFTPALDYVGSTIQPFAIYTYGKVEIQCQSMIDKPGFTSKHARLTFLQRLNEIPGVELDATAITRRPSFPLEALASAESREMFFQTIEWVFAEFRTAVDAGQ